MRIISIIAILPSLWTLIFPQVALADETINTNTKTKFEVRDTIYASSYTIPYNYEEYIPIENKSLEELKRDEILSRWKKKQTERWNNLPKGKFIVNASAYTASADECGNSKGITASGLKVKEKRTLACPAEFPFGAKIRIDGMGTYSCEDRGGAIKGNHVDIYMETKAEAFAFGRRNLTAEVVY